MTVSMYCLVSLCILVGAALALPGPELTIEQGTLQGSYLKSASGRTFAAFQGIPYAKPVIGKNRFKEPVPAKPWRGVWNAKAPGSPCLQFAQGNVFGDEDCLYLNVYVPTQTTDRKLDVIVNIHGGAFMVGFAANNGPKYLLDRDVVLVTMNYRLGPFGFFTTGDDTVPGNNGLKDQSLALAWVQRNIAAFGGNPARVTLVGTSAGGASVHLHYLSPMSKGLFQQGISLSGTALNAWTQIEEAKEHGQTLAQLLGCPTQSSRDLIDCLRHRPARAIAEQIAQFAVWRMLPFCPWGPTVEVPRPGAFLAEPPIDVLIEGRAHNVPWITGVTSEEGLYPTADFVTNEALTQEFAARWEELAPLLLDFNSTVAPGQRADVAQRIKAFYFGDKPISIETRDKLIQLTGDRVFVADAERAAKLQAKTNTAPVYFYQFAYRGKGSLSNLLSQTNINMGSSHGDDTAYIFEAFYNNIDEAEDDQAMSKLMVDWWMKYVNTGNPSPSGVDWQPLTPGAAELNYLRLGSSTDVKILSATDFGNRKFWDSLPIREAQITYAHTNRAADEL